MASTSSSSSSTSRLWKYDVFLSFRGKDTRKTFVDHLYYALKQRAIILTYKDDVTLDRGDTIRPALLSAIEASQILVIIFSENYADSSWCLDELSHIMKCRDSETGQIVFPIFYHVDPSDVRKQKGQFGEAFSELSDKNKKKVETWKKALDDASNIAGWETTQVANGHEAKCIQEIVDSILDKLASLDSTVEDEDLVGMGTRLKQLKSQLGIGSGGVRMVGIWGLGGGGKTTLATSLYLQISPNFDGCCFLGNIREESSQQNGLQSLQEKILLAVFNEKTAVQSVELGKHTIKRMLSRRNVLIVLDDVDHLDQLKALAGCRKWFGDGSRIIITTRDEHLLTTHRVDVVSPISLLSHEEAIRLFNKHAYNEDNPLQDYEMLSHKIVSYAAGLPLALIVLGSFLYDKVNDEWLSTLDRLKHHPEMDVVEKLKISYDGLKPVEKELFLDIACFYRGTKKDKVMEVLDACGFYPIVGVKVLKQKALITVSSDGEFDMHDLVQEMAHYIVRGEHPNNPEKHSRLWRREDIEDMCSRNATTENDKIEAIKCPYNYNDNYPSNLIMLVSNMKKLRFLKVTGTSFDEGPSFLSNELRYIEWVDYPASPFPESFQARKLVVLKMWGSRQKELWKGNKLTRFPSIVGMEKLEILNITDCALAEFPKIEAKMDSLKELYLNRVGIEVLPSSVGEYCTNLTSLELKYLKNFHVNMKYLCSNGVGFLSRLSRSLRKLNLGWCGLKDGEIPNEIGELSNLQELHLRFNDFTRLDFSLSRLTRLKLLDLSSCENLVELPELPSSLAILMADECSSLEEVIRDEIHTNCKWLCQVSITGVMMKKNRIGGERLLETMLQGNAAESGCMFLQLQGSKIARGFEPRLGNAGVESGCLSLQLQGSEIARPRLVRGKRCRMQLPSNWFHHFSGFLFCAVSRTNFDGIISMKHVEKLEEGDSQDDVYLEESDYYITWVWYVSFGLLRNTLWWDHTSTSTSTSIQIEINKSPFSHGGFAIGCGFKLVQMETTTTTTHSSSEISLHNDYKYKFDHEFDSKSAFKLKFC